MNKIDTVLVKVASRCNLNCDYCYIYNMGDDAWTRMPGRMSHGTLTATAVRLRELADAQASPFAVVLHGGEPLLAGAKKIDEYLGKLREFLPADLIPISIQTNGVLLSEEIIAVAARWRVSFSISIDGPADVHDKHRVTRLGTGSHTSVLAAISRLQKHAESEFLFSGVLAVIDPASSPWEIYQFFKNLNVPSVDFLYRDGNHDLLPPGKHSFVSAEYGQWLAAMLSAYLGDDTPRFRIRILDDIIKLVLGRQGRKEGIGLTNYGILIVDADGSIQKNDTLKSAFNHADRFAKNWSVFTHAFHEVVASEEFMKYHDLQAPASRECLGCPHLQVCGGGMVVHRWSSANGYNNPSIYCADQKFLIRAVHQQLEKYLPAPKAA